MCLVESPRAVLADNPCILPTLATLVAIFSASYSFRYVFHVFFERARDDYPHHPHDPSPCMYLPPGLLVGLVVAIGLVPALIAQPLIEVVEIGSASCRARGCQYV